MINRRVYAILYIIETMELTGLPGRETGDS